MPTECSRDLFGYEVVEGREVVAAFDGGDRRPRTPARCCSARPIGRSGWCGGSRRCFADGRAQAQVEHTIEAMVVQRVFGIALGYEDLIDHDSCVTTRCWRRWPASSRRGARTARRSPARARSTGSSTRPSRRATLPQDRPRRRGDRGAVRRALPRGAHDSSPEKIILDLDATDDPLHGHQEGRFFHGYYDCYCYLPLYVFCGRHLLAAKLRRSNIDASAGAVDEVARIVSQIRARWPRVEILLRADSGFARDELMAWCEAERRRLCLRPRPQPAPAVGDRGGAGRGRAGEHGQTGAPVRRFADFTYGARWTAGAGSAGWSPRPSTWPRARTRASS